MKIGYVRVSTEEQDAGHAAQERDLKKAGCDRLFEERASGKSAVRPKLQEMLEYVREGDVVTVTRLDRLARSTTDLLTIADKLRTRKAGLCVLDIPGLDTSTASGELILSVLGSIATFERRIMLERQKEGIAKAKAEGKYKGRAPTARSKATEILALHAEKVGPTEIAKRLKIGRASVYRVLKDAEGTRAR